MGVVAMVGLVPHFGVSLPVTQSHLLKLAVDGYAIAGFMSLRGGFASLSCMKACHMHSALRTVSSYGSLLGLFRKDVCPVPLSLGPHGVGVQ